jgi:hypothetical protein
MPETLIANFDITNWEQETVDELDDGGVLARAAVSKTFTSGFEDATSVATVLACSAADGTPLAYTAQERVTATIGGRSGTFVLQHGADPTGDGKVAHGLVVRGSGTGGFVGISGKIAYERDEEDHAFLTLTYDLA